MKSSIIFFLLLSFVSLYGESPVFKHLSINNGLISNKVRCAVQDSAGFMWIGTENGLSRYDGYSFLSFSLSSGDSIALPSDNILCLAVDPVSKLLWIGTTKGLCYFNHYSFEFQADYIVPYGDTCISKSRISSLYFDTSGKLWVSTPSGAYYFKDTNSPPMVINSKNYSNLVGNFINCIYEDSKGNIWIGSSFGLNIYKRESDEVLQVPHLQDVIGLFSICEDSENNMWFSTQSNGLYKYNKSGKLIHYSRGNHFLSSNYCTGIVEDDKGNILASVRDGQGLHLMQKGTSHFVTIEPDIYNSNSLKSTTLNSIYKDSFGNIWISSWNGIHFIDKNSKKFYHFHVNNPKNGLTSNSVRSFFQDSDGDIWIGTRDGGCLSRFEPGSNTFVNFKHDKNDPNSISDTYILSICEAEKDVLLIGTFSGGLNVFYKKTGVFKKYNTIFNHKINFGAVFKVFKDRYETIWVALFNELYTFDLRSKQFTLVPDLIQIRDFLDYDENYLYMVSASKGAYRYSYKKGAFESYNLQNNMFPSNTLTSINSDDNKNIWVTSYDAGLIKWDPINNATKTYQAKDGLSNNLTTAVLIDNGGKLWVSTSNGLTKFDTTNMTFKKYDVMDGLQGNEFEKGVAYKLNSGEMLFGGINGFNYFHPDSIKDNLATPRVVITDFRLFNKKVGIGQPGSPLTKHISETKDITLTHEQSVITFEFTAINFSTPEKNQYAYQLENFDIDWNYVGTTRTANYTTLPPGEYVFRVIASNNDGTWNTQGVALNITILPPWWATWWFRGLVIFLFVASTIGYYYYRIYTLRKQKNELELEVQKRTNELLISYEKLKVLNATKDKLFSVLGHDLKAPFNVLMGFGNLLIENIDDYPLDKTKGLIRYMNDSVHVAYEMLENLLNWARSQRGSIKVVDNKVNIQSLFKKVETTLNYQALSKNITLEFEIIGNREDFIVDEVLLETILRNIISNSIKFSYENGQIITKAVFIEQHIEFSINDQGVGMNNETKEKLFKVGSIISKQGTAGEQGTGLGLLVCAEFICLLKGEIRVESELNVGTSFFFTIPNR